MFDVRAYIHSFEVHINPGRATGIFTFDTRRSLLYAEIGKLCKRLMDLPGVLGVRVKIAKLEIFDDCEVAIRIETGLW